MWFILTTDFCVLFKLAKQGISFGLEEVCYRLMFLVASKSKRYVVQ